MKYLKLLLWPFSLLYGGIMLLRNYLYDTGMLRSTRFSLPVIAVGNLTVGGTGKTPHVEYLLRLLKGYPTATLSRGYKRKSKGFVLADHTASAATLGDEPFQYHRDFRGVTVAVSEDRVAGIAKLLKLKPELGVVVLDDAMQHRPVQPSLNILLTDYTRPFYKDLVLPAGILREPRQGANRADIVVVSKCPPALKLEEEQAIRQQISRYSRADAPVFFSSFSYGEPVPIGSAGSLSKRIILMTGIANAAPLVRYLEEQHYIIHRHLAFADHHHYTQKDLQLLQESLNEDQVESLSILTTRKDAVKLQEGELLEITHQLPLFYIPVEVAFLKNGEQFDAFVLQHVASF
ncbi:tetraacyldisaccharide 4'-kinase [Pontibacter roseus]|uniref:tetraacyldisaccharide 4'-kinase n=1 Tax=Pontibacter roseus TaxID=336989 RepID=UPI000373E4B6|nr:tetraacyldisaccharide 4'-kinase [Pontibacter roseus]